MRPSDGRISLWPLAVAGFVVVFALLCITPTLQLNSTPPADLILHNSSARANTAVAGAYWEVASRVIQWKYTRAQALPVQAPAEFTLADTPAQAGKAEDQALRAAYWARLREEWLRPENWHRAYEFDLSWTVNDAMSVSHAILHFIHQT
jgi:hypothetical protein